MSNVLRIALVDPNDGSRESLKAMLLGMETVWLEADCSRYEFFPDVIEQTAPDVGVVSLDDNPDQAINLIQRLADDARLGLSSAQLQQILDQADQLTGAAKQQVDAFVDTVEQLAKQYPTAADYQPGSVL